MDLLLSYPYPVAFLPSAPRAVDMLTSLVKESRARRADIAADNGALRASAPRIAHARAHMATHPASPDLCAALRRAAKAGGNRLGRSSNRRGDGRHQ